MGLVAVQAEKASELVERKSRRNESCGGGQRRREELKQNGEPSQLWHTGNRTLAGLWLATEGRQET